MIRPGCRRWGDLGYLTATSVVPATIGSSAGAVQRLPTGRPGSGPSNPGRPRPGLARSRLSVRALVIFSPLPAWCARNDRGPLHRQETRRPDARQGRTTRTLGQHRGPLPARHPGQRTPGPVAIGSTGRTGRWDDIAAGPSGPASGEPGCVGQCLALPDARMPSRLPTRRSRRAVPRAGRGTPPATAGVPAGSGGHAEPASRGVCLIRLSHLAWMPGGLPSRVSARTPAYFMFLIPHLL
jgi:hypothetical protein